MWPFNELNEAQRECVAQQCQEEYRFAPGDDRSAPNACKTDRAFRIVEETIDAAVGQFGRLVEEEITKEPAKFS